MWLAEIRRTAVRVRAPAPISQSGALGTFHGVVNRAGPCVEGDLHFLADQRKRADDGDGNQGRDQAVLDGRDPFLLLDLLDERFQPDQSISVY